MEDDAAGIVALRKSHRQTVVAATYMLILERNPDAAEMRSWTDFLLRGGALSVMQSAIKLSPHAARVGAMGSSQVGSLQLFVDVSELVVLDAASGIQRVVRSILADLLRNPPAGYRVEPVYARAGIDGYFYAREFSCRFLGVPYFLDDQLIDYSARDVFLGLDLQPHRVREQLPFLREMRTRGVQISFMVYDMLPVLAPEYFVSGTKEGFEKWLETVREFDSLICISRSVAKEVSSWLGRWPINEHQPKVLHFRLGADVSASVPSRGLPDDFVDILASLRARPAFLMVGTLEPRKGHADVISAFDFLWGKGIDVTLVIVGKQGWLVEDLVERIRRHPEFDKRLIWLIGVSDEFLGAVYRNTICLLAASRAEGFGLPLVEASANKMPILARDIPVFREVAGDHATYFSDGLPQAIEGWLEAYRQGTVISSDGVLQTTWHQSTQELVSALLPTKVY